MKKLNTIALSIAAMTCGSAYAQSDAYNPSWYVTPSVNIMNPDSDFGVDKNGEGLGLRWGKPISPRWDIQFGPTFARSNENNLRYEQTTLGADFLYMFSRNRFRPFLLMGLGVQRDKVSGSGISESRTSPYIDAGLGFQYAFSDRWSTQVDWRRVHGFLRSNSFDLDKSDNDYLTIGLTYTFDAPPRRSPVVITQTVRPAPAPAPVAPPPPPPRFERYTLSATELFAFDSDELNQPQPKLDQIAQVLRDNPSIDNVVVNGYTDRLGSDDYNNALSQRRADTVKSYLVSKGVSSDRISAVGKGESNPVVECSDKNRAALIQCLEPNRRVEVEQITIERRVK